MDFVDLQGASGQAYRFRRWPLDGAHPPIAGNYVLVRTRTREVVAVGISENLAEVQRQRGELPADVQIYTRLNIARSAREAEHADLAAAHAAVSQAA